MSDEPTEPARIVEVSGQLPVPYVTPYTDRTLAITPLLVTALSGWAVLMIEWGSLRWIDHAPVAIWIGSTAIAVCVLAVIANRDWLNFKDRRYFPVSLLALMTIWIGIVGLAYYIDYTTGHPLDPAVAGLQSQLASALRERDIAALERDAARREIGNAVAPGAPIPPPSPAKTMDDIEARIDVWKSIEGQMNDFVRILGEGDRIVANWKTSPPGGLANTVSQFRQNLNIIRGRLAQLIGSNPDFSDLRIIDQNVPGKLSASIENLLQAASQLRSDVTATEYDANIRSYIGPLRRELATVKQWSQATKSLANSSVAELSSRQISK